MGVKRKIQNLLSKHKIKECFIMEKLKCDKCFKHLCTIDEIRFLSRRNVKPIKFLCKCGHISIYYLPERIRIIEDGYYKIIE